MEVHFDYGFVSADSHVTEPPDCYQRFIDPAYRDRAPFIRHDEKRGDLYVIPGQDNMTVPMGLVAAAGEESSQMTFNGRNFEDWHRSGWDPTHRLKDQARDGVAAELLFETNDNVPATIAFVELARDRATECGREQILEVHAKGKPYDDDVNISTLARQTPGFTGADLANLINESALLAARRDKLKIGMSELEEAIEKAEKMKAED